MFDIACPDCVRRAHPATPPPNSLGTTRMPCEPSAWQDWQAFLTVSTHCSWVLMLEEIPLPFSPVPGNWSLPGMLILEYQYMTGWYWAAGFASVATTAFRSSLAPGAACTLGESTSP